MLAGVEHTETATQRHWWQIINRFTFEGEAFIQYLIKMQVNILMNWEMPFPETVTPVHKKTSIKIQTNLANHWRQPNSIPQESNR